MLLNPKTIFYDWLYINAVLENPLLAAELLKYNAFTDIEFNPKKVSTVRQRQRRYLSHCPDRVK